MSCIRLFNNTDSVVEHNLFKDNQEVKIGGVVYFKDTTNNATVRYNTFINNKYSVVYVGQNPPHNGLNVHHNLFYGDTNLLYFMVEMGSNFRFHNNVALNIQGAFFYYNNNGSNTFSDSGEYYNNVIAGTGFAQGWSTNSSNTNNLPDIFDYNLWYRSSDRNGSNFWSLPSGYHSHAITANNAVTYNSTTMTATVEDTYLGRNQGRNNSTIGGFTYGLGGDTPPPVPEPEPDPEPTPADISTPINLRVNEM
jgi:hypothetical protein